jgi:hypothetical protein
MKTDWNMIRTVCSGAGTPKTDPNIFSSATRPPFRLRGERHKHFLDASFYLICVFKPHHIYIVEKASVALHFRDAKAYAFLGKQTQSRSLLYKINKERTKLLISFE